MDWQFPTDALAEAYLKGGEKLLAITNYRKALALNPKNLKAAATLQKLSALAKKDRP